MENENDEVVGRVNGKGMVCRRCLEQGWQKIRELLAGELSHFMAAESLSEEHNSEMREACAKSRMRLKSR